jgi:hypothetical protein
VSEHDPVAAGDSATLNWPLQLNSRGAMYNSSGFVVTEDATKRLAFAACWRLEVRPERVRVAFLMCTSSHVLFSE